jgi:hypothetical protein
MSEVVVFLIFLCLTVLLSLADKLVDQFHLTLSRVHCSLFHLHLLHLRVNLYGFRNLIIEQLMQQIASWLQNRLQERQVAADNRMLHRLMEMILCNRLHRSDCHRWRALLHLHNHSDLL